MIESICPYLETVGGGWLAGRSDGQHRCGAVEPAPELSAEKQRRLCLAATHAACPTFLAARSRRPERADRDGHLAGGAPVERTVSILLDRAGPVGSRFVQAIPLSQVALAALMLMALAVVVYARVLVPGASAPAAQSSPLASAMAPITASASPSVARPTASPATASPSAPARTGSPVASPVRSVAPVSSPSRPALATRPYTVRANDTLYSIAAAFHTTVAELRALNGLSDSAINVGQVLRVPA